jgi:hypothetical protein
MYNGLIIRLDLAKINKDGRTKIRISMIIYEMEDRISKLSTRGNKTLFVIFNVLMLIFYY